MAQIQKGTTYITGDQVTAANLNALADAAILLPGAITDQTAKTVPLAADTVLIHSAADTALRKSTLTQLFANATGIPISTGVSGLGTGIATALAVNSGSAGAPVLFNGALGTPTSGTVTNLTGTASININGTVGATTPSTVAATTLSSTLGSTFATSSGNVGIGVTPNASTTSYSVLQIGSGGAIAAYRSALYDQFFLGANHFENTSGNWRFINNGYATQYYHNSGSHVFRISTTNNTAGADQALTWAQAMLVTSTGLNSTAIGATTASTGAFTTLSATGTVTALGASFGGATGTGATGQTLNSQSANGNYVARFLNTAGTTQAGFAFENSGADFATYIAGVERSRLTSTGLAVTGALSSTTGANFATSSGNVGINETSPTQGKLVINNPSGSTDSGVTGNSLYLKAATVNANLIRLSGAIATDLIIGRFGNADAFSIGTTGGATFATFNSTGLGIGTASPAAKLHISGDANTRVQIDATTTQGIYFTKAGVDNGTYRVDTNGNFEWYTKTVSQAMSLTAAGNLLVGTTSTLPMDGAARFSADGSGTNYPAANFRGDSAQWALKIGTVDTTSTRYMIAFCNNTSTSLGGITTNGTVITYGGTSDYRLKNITGPLTDSGTFIDALKPKVGTWKADGSKFVGFIAHEFAEVSPSSVSGEKDAVDSDGKPVYQGMQASSAEVIANLVAQIQELRQRVAGLETK